MKVIGGGEKTSACVYYLDLGGYVSVYTYQNSSSCVLRFVHFIICASVLKHNKIIINKNKIYHSLPLKKSQKYQRSQSPTGPPCTGLLTEPRPVRGLLGCSLRSQLVSWDTWKTHDFDPETLGERRWQQLPGARWGQC